MLPVFKSFNSFKAFNSSKLLLNPLLQALRKIENNLNTLSKDSKFLPGRKLYVGSPYGVVPGSPFGPTIDKPGGPGGPGGPGTGM